MSRPTPRRPASSRLATSRPRRIAGQPAGGRPDAPEGPEGTDELVTPPAPRAPKIGPRGPQDDRSRGTGLTDLAAGRTATTVLIGLLGGLALLLVLQAAWFVWHNGRPQPAPPTPERESEIVVPDGRPVVASELAVQEGVDAAAKAAQEIVAVDHASYDDEVDAAAELMTADFEDQYRRTAADVKDDIVAAKTVVEVSVVAQGVVRANTTELQALVFLNQVVSRERDGKPETVVTPYKVLVTMVHTDNGWLVDNLATDK